MITPLVKCNMCRECFSDTNPQPHAPEFNVNISKIERLEDHKCPNCETDAYLMDVDSFNQNIPKHLL